jgi:hypothetical protein
MRTFPCIGLTCLLLIAGGPLQAQTDDNTGTETGNKAGKKTGGPASKAPAAGPVGQPVTKAEAEARSRAWLGQCMQDWESGTHMTKKAWRRTCQRMARERTKFLLNQGR